MEATATLNRICREVGVCEGGVTMDDLDQIATILTEEATKVARQEANRNKELLLDILEHQVLGSGRVIDAARAAATPCKCFSHDSEEYCWSPGVLGLMSSKKNPEQIAQFCAVGKIAAGEGVRERFEKVKGAIEEAHREWERKGDGLPAWWTEVAKSLEKHGIEL